MSELTDGRAGEKGSGAGRPRIAIAVALSLLGWTIYLVNQPRPHSGSDLSRGWYSDHYSHMNACRAFLFGGVNIWKDPLAAKLRAPTAEERALAPVEVRGSNEVYILPSSSPAKPVFTSWSRLPRPYPPGDCVAVLPAALAFEWLDAPFPVITRFLIWLFLLYAHLGIAAFWWAASIASPPRIVAGVIVYFEAIHWALEGFYDVAALVPLALFFLFLAQRRWLAALLAYCVAAFFHFRAFFFGPLVLFVAAELIRSRAWKGWRGREWSAVGVAAVLGGLSLWTFVLTSGALAAFPLDNPVASSAPWQAKVGLFAVVSLGTGVFLFSRAYADALVTLWVAVMAINLRQAFAWHALLLLPWLLMPNPSADTSRWSLAESVRLVVVIGIAAIVFRNTMVPSWLALLP